MCSKDQCFHVRRSVIKKKKTYTRGSKTVDDRWKNSIVYDRTQMAQIVAINSVSHQIFGTRGHVSRRSTNNIPLFNDRPSKKRKKGARAVPYTSDIGARGPVQKPVRRYARLDNNTRRTVDRGTSRSSNNSSSSTSNRAAWILYTAFPPLSPTPSASSLCQHPPFSPTHRVRPELYPVSVPPSISSPRHPRTPHEAPETLLLPVSPLRPLSRVAVPTTCRSHPYDVDEGGRTCRG